MRNLLIGLSLLTCSCASVKKFDSRQESTFQHTDSSSTQREYSKVTTISETAGAPVITRPDSAALTGYLAANDTIGYSQEVTAGVIRLTTMVKPQRNSQGKTTGYTITSSATKAAEVIGAPVNRQTTISETGKELQQAAIKDASTKKSVTSDKSVFRFNTAGAITAVLCFLGAVVLYLIYRYFKNPKKILP